MSLAGRFIRWLGPIEVSEQVSSALDRLHRATECSCPPLLFGGTRGIHWESCRSHWRRDVETIISALENAR